jgi:hypothetical protein
MAIALETDVQLKQRLKRFAPFASAIVVGLFSCFYFADVLLRAREKYLWYDELMTWYLCRLPTFHDTWSGVLRGFDFNPPLFYLITRWSERVFGSGSVGIRVPEIVAFWVLSVCLFIFVRRRAGIVAGYIAMLFPMLTGAYYYAYEARPHGIVLGFCGLALVFWQIASEHTARRPLWLAAFSLSLFGACMIHCYAVLLVTPFALAEGVRTFRLRRIEWSSWFAMAIPDAIAAFTYIPLLHAYRQQAKIAEFGPALHTASLSQATNFYIYVLDPCMLILIAAFVLFALDQSGRFSPAASETFPSARVVRLHDLAIAVGLLALPFAGILLAKAVKGPFFERYFMAAVAGLAILFGLVAASRQRYGWVALALALAMTLYSGNRFAGLVWHTHEGVGEYLEEPSTRSALETTPGQPLASNPLLKVAWKTSEPIIVADYLQYLYLVRYAPRISPRLYLIDEYHTHAFNSFRAFCHIECNPQQTLEQFLARTRRFLLYSSGGYSTLAPKITAAGGRILWVTLDKNYSLAQVQIPPLTRTSK